MLNPIVLEEVYLRSLDVVKWATTEMFDIITLIYTILAVIIFCGSYYILFTPLNRIRDLGDSGYIHLKDEAKRRGRKLKDYANYVRALQKIGTVPPIYPNGWFAILESRDLHQGDVKSISALGETFAVFRTQEGEACVLDAYCPHLGANIAAGGRVFGSCIECPFHGWQFDGKTGNCVQVPYSDKVPAHSSIKKWNSVEVTGWIFIWYHAEYEEPNWYPPDIKEISNGEWIYRGRTEHFIASHIQDIPENGGDVAHLAQLHSPSMIAGVDLRYMRSRIWEFGKHVWHGIWKEGEAPNIHTAHLSLSHTMKIFGKIPLLSANVEGVQIGPALVHLQMNLTTGSGVFIQTVTPVGPLEQRMVHQFYSTKSMLQPYCNLILYGEAIMLERDIMVWSNKKYETKPILVKEDRFLVRHRRWYTQFYSENSPQLSTAKESLGW